MIKFRGCDFYFCIYSFIIVFNFIRVLLTKIDLNMKRYFSCLCESIGELQAH
jgi:hypothetical protein